MTWPLRVLVGWLVLAAVFSFGYSLGAVFAGRKFDEERRRMERTIVRLRGDGTLTGTWGGPAQRRLPRRPDRRH